MLRLPTCSLSRYPADTPMVSISLSQLQIGSVAAATHVLFEPISGRWFGRGMHECVCTKPKSGPIRYSCGVAPLSVLYSYAERAKVIYAARQRLLQLPKVLFEPISGRYTEDPEKRIESMHHKTCLRGKGSKDEFVPFAQGPHTKLNTQPNTTCQQHTQQS